MAKKCDHCGRDITDEVYCPNCGAPQNSSEKEANVVNEENISTTPVDDKTSTSSNTTTVGSKSKIVAGLLGIFLGGLGVHNFYLGYTGKAVAQLLITILSCGSLSVISGVWGFIEGILILTGSIAVDGKGVPLTD